MPKNYRVFLEGAGETPIPVTAEKYILEDIKESGTPVYHSISFYSGENRVAIFRYNSVLAITEHKEEPTRTEMYSPRKQ